MIKTRGSDIEEADGHGYTALMWAARMGQAESIGTLVDLSANLEARTKSGWTSVIHAAFQGHGEALEKLHAVGVGRRLESLLD